MKIKVAFLTAVLAVGGISPALAEAQRVKATYSLHVGGFNVGLLTLNTVIDGSEYTSTLKGHTTGLAGAFYAWKIDAVANGQVGDSAVTPHLFERTQTSRKGTDFLQIAYEGDVPEKMIRRPEIAGGTAHRMGPTIRAGALDPISALISLITTPSGSNCIGTVPVYDGKKLFNFKLSAEEVGETKVICTATYARVAGFSKKSLAKPLPKPISATLIRIQDTDYFLPDRILGKTPFGAAVLKNTALVVEPVIQAAAAQ